MSFSAISVSVNELLTNMLNARQRQPARAAFHVKHFQPRFMRHSSGPVLSSGGRVALLEAAAVENGFDRVYIR